jgi:hypothetical protein
MSLVTQLSHGDALCDPVQKLAFVDLVSSRQQLLSIPIGPHKFALQEMSLG